MRRICPKVWCRLPRVSIHASVKDATYDSVLPKWLTYRFNPRICKRCDHHIGYQPIYLKVSIHASVKDATSTPFYSVYNTTVSIHASVKDATRLPLLILWHI